jgi:hypothetical protein
MKYIEWLPLTCQTIFSHCGCDGGAFLKAFLFLKGMLLLVSFGW